VEEEEVGEEAGVGGIIHRYQLLNTLNRNWRRRLGGYTNYFQNWTVEDVDTVVVMKWQLQLPREEKEQMHVE